MLKNSLERLEAWRTIILFLVLVIVLTSPFHYAIVNLYPSRIYVGAIMWCPAIAAFITLKIKGRKISSLPWNWGSWKFIRWSYFIPALYGLITYILIWTFGFGSLADEEAIADWGKELGLFICCMEEGETGQKQLLDNYPEELIKNAKATAYFGGEFDFEKMNFFQKMIVKKVAHIDHSTSKMDYEAIRKFSKKMDRVFNPFLFLV